MFEQLTIEGWRQFQSVSIDFHPRLTVLTGANGSGKTTILNILNRHFGWSIEFVSTPAAETSSGVLHYVADFLSSIRRRFAGVESQPSNAIGTIRYANKGQATLVVPESVSQTYNLSISGQVSVRGLHIASHRPSLTYQRVDQIPTTPQSRGQLIGRYLNETISHFRGSGGRSPSYSLKEALISFAVFGYGNQAVRPTPSFVETLEGFQGVLRRVLPEGIGFRGLEVRVPEVVLLTRSGDFSLDAVSGGIGALIDLAWQIYMFSAEGSVFVATIDEPENHLHPQMQRAVLPNFVEAFPNVQFIVATHNPFILGSVPESSVYVLKFNESARVESMKLDWRDRAGSANEILRDVLGVPVTFPIWVEERLDRIAREYSASAIDSELLQRLKRDLDTLGLGRLLPESVERLLSKGDG